MTNLKKIRQKRKLTQVGLQTYVGIDQTTLSKYENGERLPSIDHLLLLSHFFGVSLDYLMDLTDQEMPYPPKEQ